MDNIYYTIAEQKMERLNDILNEMAGEDLKKIIWYHSSSINTRIKNIDYNLKTWNLIIKVIHKNI